MSKEQIEEMAKDICDYARGEICILDDKKCDMQCTSAKIAKKLTAKGYRKQSEWISVDERLPEKSKTILCTDGIYIGTVYYSGKFGFEDYAPFDKITHWMPLPEPPKMKGGK